MSFNRDWLYVQPPLGQVVVGDCLDVMRSWLPNTIDFAFADPPYNLGVRYDGYEDNLPEREYLAWCARWCLAVWRLLKKDGTFWVAIGPKMQAGVRLEAERAGFIWRNTVVWHYTFGSRQEGNFTPSWTALHYFVKDAKNYTWNPEAVRVPSARQLKYADKRANAAGKVPDNVWALLPAEQPELFRPDQDCWLESRVCGTFKERSGHPTQMPLAVLERIILACTNPGQIVLDPMAGSGSTLMAAQKLARQFVGIDRSERYVAMAQERLSENNCPCQPTGDQGQPEERHR